MSAIPAALGVLSLVESEVIDLIADCPTWQRIAVGRYGPYEAAAAKTKIYTDAFPDPPADAGTYTEAEWQDSLRPLALVYTAPEGGYRSERIGLGETGSYKDSGMVVVQIESSVPEADKELPVKVGRDFRNDIGRLIHEIQDRANSNGYPFVHNIRLPALSRGAETEESTVGDYYMAVITLEWGQW